MRQTEIDMLRRTATAALLGAMALAAVIVSQQSVGYRRRGSTDEVALAQEDAFSQELAMLSTKLTPQQVRAQRAKAEQLLAKARGEMKQRGPEITAASVSTRIAGLNRKRIPEPAVSTRRVRWTRAPLPARSPHCRRWCRRHWYRRFPPERLRASL